MRRKDRQIENREEVDSIIECCQVCRVALSMDDAPYLVPLSFGYDGDAIYLHTARTGKKIDYFEANNRVCFEFERGIQFVSEKGDACEATFTFETVIGYGTVGELTEPDQKTYALGQIALQYGEEASGFDGASLNKVRAWKISIESVEGKRSLNENSPTGNESNS